MRANIFRFISILIVVTFLSQNIAWTAPSQVPLSISYQPSANLFIPEQYGRIEKSIVHSPLSMGSSKQPLVVLVKDAHCNYEAQRNIERILDILVRDYKIDLVCVEGASGNVDTSILGVYPDKKRREIVTDKYVREGLFTASEALGIKNGFNPGFTIFGVENEKLYWKNFKTFRDTVGRIEYGERFIKLIGDIILQLKNRIYTKELQHFDRKAWEYRKNEIPLTEWIKYLRNQKPVTSNQKNLGLVIQSIELEEKIDFKAVESERANLIRELEKTLPNEGLRELVEKSLFYKLGKISPLDYYVYFEQYTNETSGQNLVWYIHLVKLHSVIDENGLFSELEEIEESIYDNLFQNESQRKLHNLDKDVYTFNKIIHLQATRDEIVYYNNNRQMFSIGNIMDFVRIQAIANGINIPEELNDPLFLDNANQVLLPADEFYKIAFERDQALVSNLLQQMEEEGKQKAVLIAGGFHGDGIRRLLEEKDVDFISITPTITKTQEDSHELYLKRMLDSRIDPDQILAETGYGNLQAVLACTDPRLLEKPINDLVEMPFGLALQQLKREKRLPQDIIKSLEELYKKCQVQSLKAKDQSLADLLKDKSFKSELINMCNGQPKGSLPQTFLEGVLRVCGIELKEKPTATVGNALGTEGYYNDDTGLQKELDGAISSVMQTEYISLEWNPTKKQWRIRDSNGNEWIWDGSWKEWDKGQNVWRKPQTQPDFSKWGITSEKLSGLVEYMKRMDLSGDFNIQILQNDNIFLHQKEGEYALAHGGSYQGRGRFVYTTRGLFNLLSAECLYELFTEESTHAEERFLARKAGNVPPGEQYKLENRIRLFYINMFILKKLLDDKVGIENEIIQKILFQEGLTSFPKKQLSELCADISNGFNSIIKENHSAARQNFKNALGKLKAYKNSRAYENLTLILSRDIPFLSVDGDMEPITKQQQKFDCVLLSNKLKKIYGLEEKLEMIPEGVKVYLVDSKKCNYLTCKIVLNEGGTISKLYINRQLFSDLRPNLLKRLFDPNLLGTGGLALFQRIVQDIKVYLYIYHGKEYFQERGVLTEEEKTGLLKLLPRPLRRWVLDSKSSEERISRLGCIYQGYISLYSYIILGEDEKRRSEQEDFYQMANQILPEMPVSAAARKLAKKAVLFGFEQRKSDFETVANLLTEPQDNGEWQHKDGEYRPFSFPDEVKPIDKELRQKHPILKSLEKTIRRFTIFKDVFNRENDGMIEQMNGFIENPRFSIFSGDNGWIKVEEADGQTHIYINEKFVNSNEDPDIREKALFFALFCVSFRWQRPARSRFINEEELLFLLSFGDNEAESILRFLKGDGESYIWKLIKTELNKLKRQRGKYSETLNKYKKVHRRFPVFSYLSWHFRNNTILAKVIMIILIPLIVWGAFLFLKTSQADPERAYIERNLVHVQQGIEELHELSPKIDAKGVTELNRTFTLADDQKHGISIGIPPSKPVQISAFRVNGERFVLERPITIPRTYLQKMCIHLNIKVDMGSEISYEEALGKVLSRLFDKSRGFFTEKNKVFTLQDKIDIMNGFLTGLDTYLGKIKDPIHAPNAVVSGYVKLYSGVPNAEKRGNILNIDPELSSFIDVSTRLARYLGLNEVLYFHQPLNGYQTVIDEKARYEDAKWETGISFDSPGGSNQCYNIGYIQAMELLANLRLLNLYIVGHSSWHSSADDFSKLDPNNYIWNGSWEKSSYEYIGLSNNYSGSNIGLYFDTTASVHIFGCAFAGEEGTHANDLSNIVNTITSNKYMPSPDIMPVDPIISNTPKGFSKIADGVYLIPVGAVYRSDIVLFMPNFNGEINGKLAKRIEEISNKNDRIWKQVEGSSEYKWQKVDKPDKYHRYIRVAVVKGEKETYEDYLARVYRIFNSFKGKKIEGSIALYNHELKPIKMAPLEGGKVRITTDGGEETVFDLGTLSKTESTGGSIGKWIAEGNLVVDEKTNCLTGRLNGIGENQGRIVKLVKESEYETELAKKKENEEVVVIKVEKRETPKLQEAIDKFVGMIGDKTIRSPNIYSISSNPYIQGYGSEGAVFVDGKLLEASGEVGFMALIHEVGHFLIGTGQLEIKKILKSLEPKWKRWYQNKLLIYGEGARAHYALRALQRQINEGADLELSRRLKELYLPDKIKIAAQKIESGLKEKGVEIDKNVESIEMIIKDALGKGERVNLEELLSTLNITPEQFFAAAVVVAKSMEGLVRNNTEGVEKVAQVLDRILSNKYKTKDSDDFKQREGMILNAIKDDLRVRGIDPDALGLDSIFDGLYLLRFDPMLDITEIDANYPNYVIALSKCLKEFSLDAILQAFAINAVRKKVAGSKVDNLEEVVGRICSPTSGIGEPDADKIIQRKGLGKFRNLYEALTGKEMPLVELPDSKLKKYFRRASLYARIINYTEIKDMDLEFEDGLLENLDFSSSEVTISGNVQAYISSQDAVAEEVDRFLGKTTRSDMATIVCDDIDNYIDKNLEIEEREDGRQRIIFHHEAGLRAVLERVKSGKLVFYNCGGDITIKGKTYEKSVIVEKILKATGMLDNRIFMVQEGKSVEGLKNELRGIENLPKGAAITILLNKGLKGDLDPSAQKQDNLRFIEIEEGPFYARLLLGFMYGGLEKVTKEAVEDLLMQFGVGESEINQIIANFDAALYFTVKLIKMKEILEQYKNTRISINTAA